MNYLTNIFLVVLLVAGVFLSGCTSSGSTENHSNPNLPEATLHSNMSIVTATKTPVSPDILIRDNETWEKFNDYYPYVLKQDSFAYCRYDNLSFEASVGNIRIQKNETGENKTFTIMIDMTAKNTCTVPLHITYYSTYLYDYFNNYHQGQCTSISLGTLNQSISKYDTVLMPGESITQTINCSVSSEKKFTSLVSDKSTLRGIFYYMGINHGDTPTVQWGLDLKNATMLE